MKIIHKIVLLILMSALGLFASTESSKWSFTTEDLYTMDDKEKEVLRIAREVGYANGLGDALVHIAGVETRMGSVKSTVKTHCGSMQISTKWAGVSCRVLENNAYLSMELAVKNLKGWLVYYKGDMKKAMMAYNGGYGYDPFGKGKEYLSRINQVKYALRVVEKIHKVQIT